jgi:hypothetical protein
MIWLPIRSDFLGDLRAAPDASKPTDCLEKLASSPLIASGFWRRSNSTARSANWT